MYAKWLLVLLTFFFLPAFASELVAIDDPVRSAIHRDGDALVAVALTPIFEPASLAQRNREVALAQDEVLTALGKAGYEVIHRFQSVPGLTLRITDASVLDKLAAQSKVGAFDLDAVARAALNESRPWVNAHAAHALGFRGAGRTVVVVDSGIDTDHPDLVSSLVGEYCVCNRGPDCCPGGGSVATGPGSAEDDFGHGTRIAGIVTSDGNVAPVGIAPDADIVAIKVMNDEGRTYMSDVTAALDWVLNNRPDVDVVNMSLGTSELFSTDCDHSYAWATNYTAAADALGDIGVLTVSLSGNDGEALAIAAPGCISGTMAVGMTFDFQDIVVPSSNASQSLDLLAPGAFIDTTDLNGGVSLSGFGTSRAAPHVAAAAAILRQQSPDVTLDQLKLWLLESPITILDDRNGLAWPRLDVLAALSIDPDGDAVEADHDNCLAIANPSQRDTDNDGHGNLCDADLNNDCIVNSADLGIFRLAFFSADADSDFNGDGVVNPLDLGIMRAAFFQPPGPSAEGCN